MGLKRELMLIDGKWIESSNGKFIFVENPAKRGTIIAEVPGATPADVDMAVKAAAEAFKTWKLVPAQERGKLLLKIADAFEAQSEEISRTLAEENGNAIKTQARPEIMGAVALCRYFGGLASELKGATYPTGEDTFAYTWREPIGVIGCLIPWNAPVGLGMVKLASALVAGNTVVLKAASDAPLAVLKMARIFSEYLPPGVINVITGKGSECGTPLAKHPLVRKLSFTGSTEVGQDIMRYAADRIVPVSLELGGKNPQIVYPDANEDYVVDGVIAAMRFTRQGQSCTAGSRLFLHKSIFDPFLEKMIEKLKFMKIGDPLDEETDMGAISGQKQFIDVYSYIADGIEEKGAKLLLGGLPPSKGPLAEGYFIEPTVFTCDDNKWRLAQEEIFGPVLVAIPWEDEDEVIRMANDTHYGLSAFVWTHDVTRGLRAAKAIETGWVQINRGLGQIVGHPYGGIKQSGFGREYCLEGMLESFTQIKSVSLNLNFPPKSV